MSEMSSKRFKTVRHKSIFCVSNKYSADDYFLRRRVKYEHSVRHTDIHSKVIYVIEF